MNEQLILETFNQVLNTHFKTLDIPRESLPEWDSMKHAELVLKLQEKLDLVFKIEDIIRVENAKELLKAVRLAQG